MLQGIRDNSKGMVAKVIVGFIVLTFAMFGVDSLVSLTQGSNAPATVNGEEITERDLYQATQLQRRSILASMGAQADPSSIDDNLLQSMVLDSLIEQKALLVQANDQDMRISEKMIDEVILNTPEFQVEGKFSAEQFDAAVRNAGFTRMSYRETVRKEQLLRQQRAGYALSSYVMPSNVQRIIALDRQTRNIKYFAMPIETVRALTNVSDEEVKAAFEAKKNSLSTQEEVSVEYVELTREQLVDDVIITDAEIDEQYQQVVAEFEAQEKRQAAHILIEVSDDVSDAQALEKVQTLKKRIDEGEDFAVLAKEFSNDFGSAENGGDLGVIEKGTFEPAFENAVFSLAQGEISAAIKSESGYHLVKVVEVAKSEAPTLAESSNKIRADLSIEKTEQLYLEKLEKLTDLAFISGDLVEVSSELGLKIQIMPAFSKQGGADTLSQNSKFIRAAFSDEVLKDSLNSSVIEISREAAVVVRVKEHFPVRLKTFSEVEQQIKNELLTDKAAKQLAQRASSAIKEIKETGDPSNSAADFELKTELNVTRVSSNIPPQVIVKAFSLAHPEDGKVSVDTVELADKSLAVVIVDKVIAAKTDAVNEQEMEAITNALSSRLGDQAYQTFVNQIKDSAEIERL